MKKISDTLACLIPVDREGEKKGWPYREVILVIHDQNGIEVCVEGAKKGVGRKTC